jgi:hypothetical protein
LPGQYTVEVTVANPCFADSSQFAVTVLDAHGIESPDFIFAVFPNPASTSVTVITESRRPLHGRIKDLTGRKVMAFWVEGPTTQVDLVGLEPGVYVLLLESEGRFAGSAKLVILR